MINSKIWWHGSDFLLLPEDEWPEKWIPVEVTEQTLNNMELKLMSRKLYNVRYDSPFGININNFSSLRRLLRVPSWIIQFIHRCQRKYSNLERTLTSLELKEARKLLIKSIHKNYFFEELKYLENKKSHKLVRQL